MGWAAAGQAVILVVLLAVCYRPLGDYMAKVFTTEKHWRVEKLSYRALGVDGDREQTWQSYLRSVIAFSFIGVILLYLLQRIQQWLPLSQGMPAVPQGIAFNTAVSFVTNTNWQSYVPEQTMGYTVQFAGLAVQNFVSAAVGISIVMALIRGLSHRKSGTVGNFWVDLTRCCYRILLPLTVVGGIILMAGGVIQNFSAAQDVTTLAGLHQQIPGGPVASQEIIKMLGTNGGGFFNANSAHPFENPNLWINLFEIFLMLVIPFALCRAFGKMVGSNKQGYAILGAMSALAVLSLVALTWFEMKGWGSATHLAGAAMEGKEQRFGISGSTLFGDASTLTSTGAINSTHDSFTALGGMITMLNMMIGEVAPGGVGSGLYGMLILAIITVFIAGLMVGRTPEYLGKKIGPREIKLSSLYILMTPTLLLVGTALSFAIPAIQSSVTGTSMLNVGPHGFSEVLYAFTSGANNNGSAFAGLTANTPWFNTALACVMLLGRLVPIVFVLALAGSLAAQDKVPATAGTLPTHRPQFVTLLGGVTIVLVAMTYLPMLALGPLAEGLH